MWKSDLAVWLLVWPGVALSAALMLWNVCAGVKDARAWLAQQAYERAVKAARLANPGRLAQLGALALLLSGCGETGGTPLACGMGALLIITSLIGGEETAEANGPEEGAEDMQTNAAEGTPAAKPRSITISHTPGQGITLHIDEGLRAAIAEGVKNDVFAAVDFTTKIASALTESENAPVIKKSIFEAVRTVIMGTRKPEPKEALAEAIAAYEDLLFYDRDKLKDAEAAMQGPEELRPRPEDVAVMRAEVAHLEAKIAQLKADQVQEATAPSAPADDGTSDGANREPLPEVGNAARQLEQLQAFLKVRRADLEAAEASWNAPEGERKSYEEINAIRSEICSLEETLASLKTPDTSAEPAAEPAAPAAELPTEMTSAQPA